MSFPVLFQFPQEPAGSSFNWTHYVDVHLPMAAETYEGTSFSHIDVITFGPNDPFQVVALSYFEEQDYAHIDIQHLWDDLPYFTGSVPVITPGELIMTFP